MTTDRIAIVGMACRYPDAATPGELWQNVLGRRRAFRRIPECRLPGAYLGGREDADLAYVTRAAVLRDWTFDRTRFGVPGPLYRAADQTHWLALETAADALADAGHPRGEGLDRDTAGVILGNSLTGEFSRAATLRLRWPFLADAAATAMRDAGTPDHLTAEVLTRLEELVKQPFPVPGDETLAGALSNTIAGRICNHFDLHGTGYTVDGACSSSLLAVMTACRALAGGEYSFLLAGGVDMSMDPFELVGFSRLGALADGDMRVYDADPTGFLPGEGCGVIALMRREDADRLGIRSYADIIGWASSSDGAGGLTRPGHAGQVRALRRAYRAASVHAARVRLIEGHGTGTAVGDRVELEALATVRHGAEEPAALGTIKANIGHTKAAAGVAGLIKTALAIHHRVLPPTTGCRQPHELLRRPAAPLRVLDGPEPWPDPAPCAGVSSMGFGGINVHIVLTGDAGPVEPALLGPTRTWSARTGPEEIVLVGSGSVSGLAERLTALSATASWISDAELRDLAATWWRHRTAGPYRAALVATTPAELASAARRAAAAARDWDGELRLDHRHAYALGSARSAPRVGLLFPGQAAPVRTALPWWADHLTVPDLPPGQSEGQAGTATAQPAIVRQSLAGLAWLRELGCRPVLAVGHSLGEICALHWAGACDAEVALRLAVARGRLMAEHGVADSAMASLEVGAGEVDALLDGVELTVAGYNAPGRLVVSGPRADIATVLDRAARAGVAGRRLAVSHGFHSPAMAPVRQPLRHALDQLPITATRQPVISTITGAELHADGDELRSLLVDQLTSPVRFSAALVAAADACDLLVEVGPGTMLTSLVPANGLDVQALSMDCGGHPGPHAFLTAALAAGTDVDLEPWFRGRPCRAFAMDRTPEFVANPCENREGWVRAAVRTKPAPVPVPEQAAAGADGPLEALTAHLATTLELPAASILPVSSLAGDLHLNSLQVVQAVAAVATGMARRLPAAPLSLADATVGEAARVLAALPPAGADEPPVAAGVRGWVRPFVTRWQPFAGVATVPATRWSVDAPAGHWSHGHAASGTRPCDGLVLVIDDDMGPAEIADRLTRVAATRPERLAIIHYGHPAAAATARSVAAEIGGCAVVVVELTDRTHRVDLDALGPVTGYLELRSAGRGSFERATMCALELGAATPSYLDAGDLCLVTGGLGGITAYSAAELAGRTGCTLVVLGRTPADDPAVRAALGDLRARVDAEYVSCDVADPVAVREMLATVGARGPVRGLVHGAGVNEPRKIADITAESFRRALRPKVSGLRTLLDAVGAGLRLVLGFGSIIGRQGLTGQAEYCVANDWLRVDLERWAAAHPHCRTHVLEWSVWDGIGMGVRLDVLDDLRRRGVEPIAPREGVAALFGLLADPAAPTTVLLASRFPATPTLSVTAADDAGPWPRFAERVGVRVPGVEAVLEADLSLGADPYLDDHRVDGLPVLPAVLGMEAMAQTAAVAGAVHLPCELSDVEFRAPVVVSGRTSRRVQTAALVAGGGTDVVLRDDTDRFATDRMVARLAPGPSAPAPRQPAPAPPDSPAPPGYYGRLLFQGARFQRLVDYDVLSAFRVRAWIRSDPDARWFSEFHSGRLVLGDPGAHDATLHVLAACVPHRRVLPVGVDRVTVWRRPSGPLLVDAHETGRTADTYEFDVDVCRPDGHLVARWQRLRLRAIGALDWPAGMPRRLVGPWLSRRLVECGLVDDVELVVATGDRTAGAATAVVRRLTGRQAWHDAAGALRSDECELSASYTGGGLLVALAADRIGIDWETVPSSGSACADVLGGDDRRTARLLADRTEEDLDLAATRVWSAREALTKLGMESCQRLRVAELTEDGLAVLRAGAARVVTVAVRTDQTPSGRTVAAIATGHERVSGRTPAMKG